MIIDDVMVYYEHLPKQKNDGDATVNNNTNKKMGIYMILGLLMNIFLKK